MRNGQTAEARGDIDTGYRVRLILRLLAGLALLAILAYQVDLRQVWELLRNSQLQFLAYAALAHGGMFLTQCFRLGLLLGVRKTGFGTVVRLSFIGIFVGSLLPSNLAGDAYKVAAVRGLGDSWGASTGLIAMDRLAGLAGVALVVVLILLFQGWPQGASGLIGAPGYPMEALSNPWKLTVGAVLVLGIVIAVWFGTRASGRRFLRQVSDGWRRISPARYAIVVGTSVAAFLFRVLRVYFLLVMLNSSIGVGELVLVVGGLSFAALIPGALGGLGIQESAIAFGLAYFGVPLELGAGVAVANRILIWLFAMVGGVLLLRTGDRSEPRNEPGP